MSTPAPSERILIVDDEDQIRTLLARLLSPHGYECLTAESAAAARRLLKETEVALVLSDVNMPGESGIDFTREVLAQYPDTAVVMVTGMDDRRYAEIAIELGAYGYVLKPFKPNELIINVGNALRRRTLEIENRSHRERLEQTVLDRTAALRDTIARLESSDSELRRLREETIRRLSWAAEFRNQETGEHIVRMSLYCALLARLAGPRDRARRADPDREPDARRRQDRDPRPDPAQARPPDRGRARGDGGAHRDGPPDPRRLRRRAARPRRKDGADPPRADRRHAAIPRGLAGDEIPIGGGSARSRTSSTRSRRIASTGRPSSRTRRAR